ncbi:ATP-dependent DNA helicase [Iningainema tapete]|uniref:AAA family ATPase n=1 Tax=Iningainema tapete BLCC-T55 TaxID=2748662 RepID=A0A8J6XEL4_9CYAN|nr:AAA family ATPase [Iningainema tapete]MBD2771011.1 AAA family ATPase [Iningainema tapete BLCC-T55]
MLHLEQILSSVSTLSSGQSEALNQAIEWYQSKPEQPYILRGYAGTGKTYVVHIIIKVLQRVFQVESEDKSLKTAICAPTHKARAVLEASAYNTGLKNVHIATLHSLLHVMPGEYDQNGKQKLIPNKWTREPHYRTFNLVVVDEASMIGTELYNMIPYDRIPTIFMGDPAQLPPIEDELDESPVFSLPTGIELMQVMRYEGAIASYVTALRNNITSQFPPRLYSAGNITKMKPEAWQDELISRFQDVDLDQDPNNIRVLAWTNKRVETINKTIRSAIYGEDAEPFVEGEILMAKDVIITRDDENNDRKTIVMYSCQECVIINVKPGSVRMMTTGAYIDIYTLKIETDTGKEASLLIVHPDSWNYMKDYLKDFRTSILREPPENRGKRWQQWYEILEIYNLAFHSGNMMHRLQYAYALTVHQSQGSTFKNVFVDTVNIFGCRQNKLRNQLLYVAYSRASENLYISSKF